MWILAHLSLPLTGYSGSGWNPGAGPELTLVGTAGKYVFLSCFRIFFTVVSDPTVDKDEENEDEIDEDESEGDDCEDVGIAYVDLIQVG